MQQVLSASKKVLHTQKHISVSGQTQRKMTVYYNFPFGSEPIKIQVGSINKRKILNTPEYSVRNLFYVLKINKFLLFFF